VAQVPPRTSRAEPVPARYQYRLAAARFAGDSLICNGTDPGRPAIICDDYFDEKIVEGTEVAGPKDTTRENILAEAGYEQVYDIDEIITRMPAPDEIAHLGIPPGTPVAEHIRTGYTADNKPVRLMISIVPGDTLILQYTVPT
jgi:DNA-binding GntR family transcriptional regulator